MDKEQVQPVSGRLVPVEAMQIDSREKRLMEKHKFVSEWSLQLRLQPCKLFPHYSGPLAGKLRVQKNEERVPIEAAR